MEFYKATKKNLFRVIDDIKGVKDFIEIRDYILALKNHSDYRSYFDNVVESIKPIGPETDSEVNKKYNRIGSNLAIVAGHYYGRDLSLKHIKRDYPEEIATNSLNDEALKQEVTTFTRHLLFGKEASGVESVGELQIEQEGLVPMMNRIMGEVEGDEAQKNELMKHLRVYGLLSENSLKEAAEAAQKDPNLILLRNTLANRSVGSGVIKEDEVRKEDNDSKDSEEVKKASFVEKYASNKKSDGTKKTVTFSLDK
jgi:hypothetical protein